VTAGHWLPAVSMIDRKAIEKPSANGDAKRECDDLDKHWSDCYNIAGSHKRSRPMQQ
jgi:hypothetical protein